MELAIECSLRTGASPRLQPRDVEGIDSFGTVYLDSRRQDGPARFNLYLISTPLLTAVASASLMEYVPDR